MKKGRQWPAVVITEEVMREGMQVEDVHISIDDKARLLERLSMTGLDRIVVGSFVSPKWTPQMAKIDELVQRIVPVAGVTYLALAINQRGYERLSEHVPPLTLDRTLPCLAEHLCGVFSMRNYNRTPEQVRSEWGRTISDARSEGIREAGISIHSAWGSNWSGPFTHDRRMQALDEQVESWTAEGIPVVEVSLYDPMGWNMPHLVSEDLVAIKERFPGIHRFHLHLHNQRGMATASIYAAMSVLGPSDTLLIETTLGGIGGCPYCGNGRAAGMAATEDVVQMLQCMGVDSPVDLWELCEVAAFAAEVIGRPLDGHVSRAGPLPDQSHLYPLDLPTVETHEEALHFRRGAGATLGRSQS